MKRNTILFSISITISSIIFFLNYKLIKKHNNLVSGQLALQLRDYISSVKRRMEDFSIQFISDNPELAEKLFDSIIEDLCNAYDQACSLYLSNKLDKDNFKQQYLDEIKNIVEDDDFKDKYKSSTTKYQATRTVYNKWFPSKK